MKYRWFVRGDLDGFFGLALDNLVQLLLIDSLCRYVLGFPSELLYGRILPGVAISLLIGNLFYAWQARRLAMRDGRTDVCALPYGINTVSLLAYVFLVMLPAKFAAVQAGATDPAKAAWQAGLAACLGSGIIELSGAFVAERIRRATPRAALLATLAGIAVTFISLGFLFRTFARPIVGLTTLGIILLVYFGRLRFKGGIPGGLVAVLLGTLLAWITGIAPDRSVTPGGIHLQVPIPALGDLVEALSRGYLWTYLAIIVPMGLFNVIGSLQNIESAEAAGDAFDTRTSLAVNGIGSLAAALFGSCFPTTIYIGHPGWKSLGARAGYSILNAVFATSVCVTGTLAHIVWAVPVDAGMAIVLWIGIVITAQAFQAIPREHAPAAVVGLLPAIGAWGAILTKNAFRAADTVMHQGTLSLDGISGQLADALRTGADTWIHGAFALEQGFIFSSMILAAATVAIIERQFLRAAAWCWVAAGLSFLGLMHSYQWTPKDTVMNAFPMFGGDGMASGVFPWLQRYPTAPWIIGYTVMGLCFLLARWVTEPGDSHESRPALSQRERERGKS